MGTCSFSQFMTDLVTIHPRHKDLLLTVLGLGVFVDLLSLDDFLTYSTQSAPLVLGRNVYVFHPRLNG